MGVVLARCTRCERALKVTVQGKPGHRLRNVPSPCCGKRMRKATSWGKPKVDRP